MTRRVECPCFFQSLSGVVIELHMDDVHGAGPLVACNKIIEQLKKRLRLKVSPPLEPEVRYQHLRRHRVRTQDGAFIGSERRHIDNVLHALGLEAANGAPTPSLASGQDDGDPLTQDQHRLYRSCVGSLLYISHDRPDILWDAGLLSGRMSAPHDIDKKRLVRVARYLKGQPNLGAWLPQNKKDQGSLITSALERRELGRARLAAQERLLRRQSG